MDHRPPKPSVLFVDDDPFRSMYYVRALQAQNLDVDYTSDIDDALTLAGTNGYDAVVIDVMMPYGEFFDEFETAGGYKTGIALAREMRESQPGALLIALTNSTDADVQSWFSRDYFAYYCKRDLEPEDFAVTVRNKIQGVAEMPQIFIVHGHDREALLSLKNYLQNVLRFPEPIILAEKPSKGMTLIEKFEHYASDSDVVFALFTPDDFKDDPKTGGRARQNVVFEYGYFIGMLGRRSGRVFLLHKQPTDIPSDLRGVIYIDITNGIEASGEEIRRELDGLFSTP